MEQKEKNDEELFLRKVLKFGEKKELGKKASTGIGETSEEMRVRGKKEGKKKRKRRDEVLTWDNPLPDPELLITESYKIFTTFYFWHKENRQQKMEQMSFF